MARPRVYGKRVSTGVRLPVELHERLTAVSIERDVSINHLMCRAIEAYLDRLEPVAVMFKEAK